MLLFVLYLSEYDNDCLFGLPCNRNSFMGIIYFMIIPQNIRLLESHTFLLCKNGLYTLTLNSHFSKVFDESRISDYCSICYFEIHNDTPRLFLLYVELTLMKECWIRLGTCVQVVLRIMCLENGNTIGFLALIVSRHYTNVFLLLLKQFFLLPNRISQFMDLGTSVRLSTLI